MLRGWCIRLSPTFRRGYLTDSACCVCERAGSVDAEYFLDLYLYTLPNDEHVWAHRPCAESAGLKKFSKK